MTGWIILTVLVLLAVAAPRYGVDTRTGDSWNAQGVPAPARRAHSLRADVAALTAAVSRYARAVASH